MGVGVGVGVGEGEGCVGVTVYCRILQSSGIYVAMVM